MKIRVNKNLNIKSTIKALTKYSKESSKKLTIATKNVMDDFFMETVNATPVVKGNLKKSALLGYNGKIVRIVNGTFKTGSDNITKVSDFRAKHNEAKNYVKSFTSNGGNKFVNKACIKFSAWYAYYPHDGIKTPYNSGYRHHYLARWKSKFTYRLQEKAQEAFR